MSFGGFFSKWCCCCGARNVDGNAYPEFNYENIIAIGSFENKSMSYGSNIADDFIHVGLTIEEISNSQKRRLGWKLHIGVYYKDIPRAWNIIKDILIRYNIFHAKGMLKDTALREQSKKRGHGREITIYAFNEPPDRDNWNDFLQELDVALKNNNIQKVNPSPACAPLSGYRYISCRCDQGEEDNDYLGYERAIEIAEGSEKEAYNPYGRKPPKFLENLIEFVSPRSLKMEME